MSAAMQALSAASGALVGHEGVLGRAPLRITHPEQHTHPVHAVVLSLRVWGDELSG